MKKKRNPRLEIYATVHTMVLSFLMLSVIAASLYLMLYGYGGFSAILAAWFVGMIWYKVNWIKHVEMQLREESDHSRLEAATGDSDFDEIFSDPLFDTKTPVQSYNRNHYR